MQLAPSVEKLYFPQNLNIRHQCALFICALSGLEGAFVETVSLMANLFEANLR